jgi:hypothetical protein
MQWHGRAVSHDRKRGYHTGVMADLVYLETTVISALFDEREDPVCVAQHIQMKQWYDATPAMLFWEDER